MENKNSLISYFNLCKALIVFKIVTLRNIF